MRPVIAHPMSLVMRNRWVTVSGTMFFSVTFFWVATTAQSPLFSATVVMFSWAIALKAYSGGEMRMSDWIQWSRKCQDTNPLGRGVPPERRS